MGGKSTKAALTGPFSRCYDAAVTFICWGYFILAFVFPFCLIYGGAWLLPGLREARFNGSTTFIIEVFSGFCK